MILIASLTWCINRALSLDPQRSTLLAGLPSPLALSLTDCACTLVIHPTPRALQITLANSEDLTNFPHLSGTIGALIAFIIHPEPMRLFQEGSLRYHGPPEVLRCYQACLSAWDPALNYHIRYLPAPIRFGLAHFLRQHAHQRAQRHITRAHDFATWLKDELWLFPGQSESAVRFDELMQLVMATDRLEARLRGHCS